MFCDKCMSADNHLFVVDIAMSIIVRYSSFIRF